MNDMKFHQFRGSSIVLPLCGQKVLFVNYVMYIVGTLCTTLGTLSMYLKYPMYLSYVPRDFALYT